ncbi:hypothetical protein [Ensifer adhaerens]|uniref:hypothetical protein n=1 Tax=Ensifer adhaerens TaxID=106592 RepID=UPI0018F7EB5A|nr:hypothetical protein [Ensifer adhaerens]
METDGRPIREINETDRTACEVATLGAGTIHSDVGVFGVLKIEHEEIAFGGGEPDIIFAVGPQFPANAGHGKGRGANWNGGQAGGLGRPEADTNTCHVFAIEVQRASLGGISGTILPEVRRPDCISGRVDVQRDGEPTSPLRDQAARKAANAFNYARIRALRFRGGMATTLADRGRSSFASAGFPPKFSPDAAPSMRPAADLVAIGVKVPSSSGRSPSPR